MFNNSSRKVLGIAWTILLVGCAVVIGADPIEYNYESGWPIACTTTKSGLVFDVSFNAENRHENGVIILQVDDAKINKEAVDADTPSTPPAVARFNGHFRRGASGYWQDADRQYVAGWSGKRACYLIISRHKRTGPSSEEPWISSHFRIRDDYHEVGFADFADRRYINAVVKVSRT